MEVMIHNYLRILFSILLFSPLGLSAQQVTGSWYGKAELILAGQKNSYMAELTLKQKGTKVEGVLGYYFKSQYRSFLIKGTYNSENRLLSVQNIPMTYFASTLEDAAVDCFMTLEATLTVSRTKSSLRGYILRDSIYRYTCPDLNIQLTRDPEANTDSILAKAKAVETDWKTINPTQITAKTAKPVPQLQVKELTEEAKQQIRKELEQEVRAELRKELETEVREQLKKDMAIQFLQELKKEIEQQIKSDVKKDIEAQIKSEVKKEFEAQLRQELKKEIEQQVRTELRKEFEEQLTTSKKEAIAKAGSASNQDARLPVASTTGGSTSTGTTTPLPGSTDADISQRKKTSEKDARKGQLLPGIRLFGRVRERNRSAKELPGNGAGVETVAASTNKRNENGNQKTSTEVTAPTAMSAANESTSSISGMISSNPNRSREVTSSENTLKSVKAFEERILYLTREIELKSDSIRVVFYDNGDVDGDTITVFYNKIPVLEKQRLTTKGIELGIRLDSKSDLHDLSMFAENMGAIPPNTALMVIYDGNERHEVFLSSTLRVNGTVRMKKKKL